MTAHINHDIVKILLASPQAPLLVANVQEILEKEQKKRIGFYNDITPEQKAEFINGEIIIHSPARNRHLNCVDRLYNLVYNYVRSNNLGLTTTEKAMISLTRNDYEPDICFFGQEKSQFFDSNQALFPAPDFIAEVLSPSTEHRDRGVKYDDYAAHGVQEYWIIDPEQKNVEQYFLAGNEYRLQIKARSGNINSLSIKDFSIPIIAIFDNKANNETLRKLLR